ncbi:phosphotransferase [Ilumatobacter sp.]|uniref:phosphotransferase n=1 Tax=Ilumatobacter sp. TaxID=1967498 RepID=UPI003B51E176
MSTRGTTNPIAGLEVGLPRTVDDVDAEWMTQVLRASGAIDPTSTVAEVATDPFLAGGLLGLLYRCRLRSTDARCPETVIAKFPMDVPAQRALADAFGIYRREVTFYRDIAPRSTIHVPVVHAAIIDDDGVDYCLVMEDLGHLRQPDPEAGIAWDDAVLCIRALAAYHSDWHLSPELESLTDPFVSIGSDFQRSALPGISEVGWEPAKLHASDVMSDSVVAFGDRWVERLDAMLDLMCANPTLCHQDWRSDNMFITSDDEVVVIDPQIVGVANGAYDIGYFISQSMERSERAGRGPELIGHYVDEMGRRGHDLDAERVLFDTRVAIGLCLMYGFSSYAQYDLLDERGKAMTRKLLRRGAESIDDFASAEAVDELVARGGSR